MRRSTLQHYRMSRPFSFNSAIPPLCDRDHIRGQPTATITLMKYGDYQCPHSGQAHNMIQTLQQQLGNQLCFVFRHFPQPQLHPQSYRAAETAEAAGAQDKFWEMHDTLFTHQDALEDSDLLEHAVSLGLDVTQLLSDFADRVYAERVQADVASGQAYGVTETPTFFIGIRHQGTQNLDTLLHRILEAIAPQ